MKEQQRQQKQPDLLLLTKDHRVSTDYGRRGRKRGRKNGILLQQLKRNQPSNSVQPERQRQKFSQLKGLQQRCHWKKLVKEKGDNKVTQQQQRCLARNQRESHAYMYMQWDGQINMHVVIREVRCGVVVGEQRVGGMQQRHMGGFCSLEWCETMVNVADWVGGQWRVGLRKERRIVQSIQIYQKETHVHKNKHDEKYRCIEIQCQDNDN